MSSNAQPHFSAGSDAATLETFLSPLLTTNGGRWTLTNEGEALEREFKFKTFAKTWVSCRLYLSSYASPSQLQLYPSYKHK